VRAAVLDRQRRNDVQDQAYAAMRDYRATVLGMLATDHALVESLRIESNLGRFSANAI